MPQPTQSGLQRTDGLTELCPGHKNFLLQTPKELLNKSFLNKPYTSHLNTYQVRNKATPLPFILTSLLPQAKRTLSVGAVQHIFLKDHGFAFGVFCFFSRITSKTKKQTNPNPFYTSLQ